MTTIHKYTLPPQAGTIIIPMPVGATILKIDNQFNTPRIWAAVDPGKTSEQRMFYILPTGSDVPDGLEYIDTVILHGGADVYHIFEEV